MGATCHECWESKSGSLQEQSLLLNESQFSRCQVSLPKLNSSLQAEYPVGGDVPSVLLVYAQHQSTQKLKASRVLGKQTVTPIRAAGK